MSADLRPITEVEVDMAWDAFTSVWDGKDGSSRDLTRASIRAALEAVWKARRALAITQDRRAAARSSRPTVNA